jgi:flagellar FliJ protein
MAKFAFKLEGVLRHRKQVEEQRQRDLAVVQAMLTELEAELRGLDGVVRESLADLRENRLVGRLDMHFIGAHRRFMLATQRKAAGLIERMAGVQREVEAARKLLVEAATQRKVIEKLREKQLERWKAELARKEMAEQDEVNVRMGYELSVEAGEE